MKHPRIILADDHRLFLDGLQNLLTGKFEIVGIARSGDELLEVARRVKTDVIITDIGMPQMNGVAAAEILAREGVSAKIIVLTMQVEIDVVLQAFRAGVSAYVTKNDAGAELAFAINEALAGRTYISPYIAKALVSSWMGSVGTASALERMEAATPFTPRQIDVLRLIIQGKTMKEAASALGISPRTAEVHKYHMMERLHVRTVPELIQRGIRSGLVDINNGSAKSPNKPVGCAV